MSIHSRMLVMFGVTLVIPIGIAVGNRVDADEPQRGDAVASSAGSSSAERFLLLSNGQILQGVVSEDQAGYRVAQRVGVLKVARKRVEGVFGSVREIYRYKLDQLPERDSEERMKLAHWCLNHQMIPEAREQLSRVVALSPHNQQAQAMLVSIEQAATVAEMRQRDPEVRQTQAERLADERPAALDSNVIRGAQSALRISDSPVIFNLPKPLAVTRAAEFSKYVHPLLQADCAKCHNETYNGAFQLVQYKSRLDHTSDALRANLDATLRQSTPKICPVASSFRAHFVPMAAVPTSGRSSRAPTTAPTRSWKAGSASFAFPSRQVSRRCRAGRGSITTNPRFSRPIGNASAPKYPTPNCRLSKSHASRLLAAQSVRSRVRPVHRSFPSLS